MATRRSKAKIAASATMAADREREADEIAAARPAPLRLNGVAEEAGHRHVVGAAERHDARTPAR